MKNNFNLKIFEIEILIPQDDLEITIADISYFNENLRSKK